jgi:hypothetical protein
VLLAISNEVQVAVLVDSEELWALQLIPTKQIENRISPILIFFIFSIFTSTIPQATNAILRLQGKFPILGDWIPVLWFVISLQSRIKQK